MKITKENLVKCLDYNGDVVAIPAVTKHTKQDYFRHLWSLVIFTPGILPPERLSALYNNFRTSYHSGTWNGKTLDPIESLTPSPFLGHPEGIGKWICPADLERVIKKLYPTFAPRTGWGSHANHKALLASLWPAGTWSLQNSNTFGVPVTWMSPEARNEYSKLNAKANKKPKK
jgi:hypothetical protein